MKLLPQVHERPRTVSGERLIYTTDPDRVVQVLGDDRQRSTRFQLFNRVTGAIVPFDGWPLGAARMVLDAGDEAVELMPPLQVMLEPDWLVFRLSTQRAQRLVLRTNQTSFELALCSMSLVDMIVDKDVVLQVLTHLHICPGQYVLSDSGSKWTGVRL